MKNTMYQNFEAINKKYIGCECIKNISFTLTISICDL